jgi:hypothetical protein
MAHSSNGSHHGPGASTLAVHAGEQRQKAGNAITDSIVCSSTYTFESTQAVLDFMEQKQDREEYGRYGNPGEKVVERKLSALEGGEDAILYASGMAAIVGLLMAKLNAGDEVVFFDECYHRSREFCKQHLSRFGVVTRQVKACDYEAMEAAINPLTKLLISESPTNPHLSIVDLERFADLGHRYQQRQALVTWLVLACSSGAFAALLARFEHRFRAFALQQLGQLILRHVPLNPFVVRPAFAPYDICPLNSSGCGKFLGSLLPRRLASRTHVAVRSCSNSEGMTGRFGFCAPIND